MMKHFKNSLFIIFCFLLFSCIKSENDFVTVPQIKSGIAYVSGKIVDFKKDYQSELNTVRLNFPNPITAEIGIINTNINDDGSFCFEIPLECDNVFGVISKDDFSSPILIELAINKKNKIEIIRNMDGSISVETEDMQKINPYDMVNSFNKYVQIQQIPINRTEERRNKQFYKLSPEEFAKDYIDNDINKRLAILNEDTTLSHDAKTYIYNQVTLNRLNSILLEYEEIMYWIYEKTKLPEEPDYFVPQEPSLSYYSFLAGFNLNNPYYLQHPEYFEALEKILSNKVFNIQPIRDTPVAVWLQDTKHILSGLTRLDNGQLYELLVAYAYIKQFKEDVKPLTDKQKDNLRSYPFKNKDIVKILMEKNETIVDLSKNMHPVVVNNVPVVAKENLMEAILAKYKGKIVVVDFWATWCGPCLVNMKEYHEIKFLFSQEKVTFVYITNTSSPKNIWEEKIKTIHGEHYYLKEDEWNYLLDHFGFSGIPTYLFYDAEGVLRKQQTGTISASEMKQTIEQLL